jgi:hypothetical protein
MLRGPLPGSGEPKLLPVEIRGEEAVDLSQPIDIPDLVAIIIQRAEEVVLLAEGRSPDEAIQDGYLKRIWTWLTHTDLSLKNASVGLATGASLTLEMKTRPDFRKQVRERAANRFTLFLREAREELDRLSARATRTAAGFSGIVVIFDSLEKLRGTSDNWQAVLASAEQVFGAGAPYLELPVHAVYTIPVALQRRVNEEIEFMPLVKLRAREGKPFEPGVSAMRDLIRRRIPDEGLSQLLGSEYEKRVDDLISASGGYPREIVAALRWLLELDKLPATDDDLRKLGGETRARFRAVLTEKDLKWLARVDRAKRLVVDADDDRVTVERALLNHLVLYYLNNEDWFDIHPALRSLDEVLDAIRNLAAAAAPGGPG